MRIPASDIIAYCNAVGVRDVEWMMEMVQQLDAYVMGRNLPKEEEETDEPPAEPKTITKTSGTIVDPYAK